MARTEQEYPIDRALSFPIADPDAQYVCSDCNQPARPVFMRYPEYTWRCKPCFINRYHEEPKP